jgi:hypothetical protein
VEGEAAEVGFAAVGELEVAAADCGLSEPLDCADWAISSALLRTNVNATNVEARSKARASLFMLRFIVLFLTENTSLLERRPAGIPA